MKIVSSAVIKVVRFSDLKIGDNILWGNCKRRITQIDMEKRNVSVDNPYNNRIENLRLYANYYVIESCEETDIYPY